MATEQAQRLVCGLVMVVHRVVPGDRPWQVRQSGMAGQRIGEWYLWQPEQRARMINRLSRRAIENPRVADLYWQARERRAVLSSKFSRRALADPRIAQWYWDRRDKRARMLAGGAEDRDVKSDRIPVVQWAERSSYV